MDRAHQFLNRIHALPLPRQVRVMNVCGGHERTIAMAGLRAALPDGIELIAGPGCPVCVCPEEDIHTAISLARRPNQIVVSFGEMLRVPCNGPRAEPRSLLEARSDGADVRPIASPQDAVRIARSNPTKEVVFFAAGFETTMAPIAGLVAQGVPDNLSLLISGRRTWPAVAMLLSSEETPGFEALIAPGHVATVMGHEEWRFVTQRHRLPVAISGFALEEFLAALLRVLLRHLEGLACLDNAYGAVVRPNGNPTARRVLDETMDVVDANWRGIGVIPRSGFALKSAFGVIDAQQRFAIDCDTSRKHIGEMPPGCDCGRVVLGKIRPTSCALYGKACTPSHPIGPCMVSDEGACRIWWSSGVREETGVSIDTRG